MSFDGMNVLMEMYKTTYHDIACGFSYLLTISTLFFLTYIFFHFAYFSYPHFIKPFIATEAVSMKKTSLKYLIYFVDLKKKKKKEDEKR